MSVKPIEEVIAELNRNQCQFLLHRIRVLFLSGSDQALRGSVQAHLDVEDLTEADIREVCDNV